MGTDVGPTNNGAGAAHAGVEERAVSLAHRMLSGAGQASVVAYRLEGRPALASVAHGLTRHGELVVATTVGPAEVGAEVLVPGEPMDVRVDITKVAPEPDVRIVAASMHLLASLEWLHPLDAELLRGTGELPDLVAAVAGAPGGRLAVLDTARVVLHDGTGATPLAFAHLQQHGRDGAVAPGQMQELESAALDAVTDVDRLDLAALCDAAERGWIPAHLLTRKPSLGGCQHTLSRDFVVDVDRTGVTVLRHGAEETSVYFVPFDLRRSASGGAAAHLRTLLGVRAAA